MNKLIIWDFDGVIADSEKIYLRNRQNYFNQNLHLNWDFTTTINNICGLSDLSNREFLRNMGYETNDKFWSDLIKIHEKILNTDGLSPTKGIENIIKKIPKQCIATGGVKHRTITKLNLIGFWQKYFNEQNLFTVDMVKRGKPAPDLFLYAANKMNIEIQNCIVIEDSIAGIKAAQKANMDIIAFLGSEICQNDFYIKSIKNTGVEKICFSMDDVDRYLSDNNVY